MNLKKIFCLIIFLLCIIPYNVFAFCSSSSRIEYRSYARDVKIKYSFVDNNVSGGNFRLSFSNMNYKIYAKDKNTGAIFKRKDEDNNNETVSNNTLLQGGTTRTIEYYTIDDMCPNDVIYTIKLNIPKYNIYYNTETCSGITNYEYCNKYIFTTLSDEEVKNKIDNYRKSHEIEVIVENDNKFNYIIPIIIGISVIVIIVVVILLIKRKRKKDLEWD